MCLYMYFVLSCNFLTVLTVPHFLARQGSAPALISANFSFLPPKLQKKISQLILTGIVNFGSSDFSVKL